MESLVGILILAASERILKEQGEDGRTSNRDRGSDRGWKENYKAFYKFLKRFTDVFWW